ncbi:MAG: hypothetical protein EZS28_030890 [Streblomastix strix]|uniref:Armadillo-type fold n=1 Tax=Streblomastix strix TaxID=222440 RepID=A0A5J4UU08_9EUKA|nr:MAG: hypothetical protein EZS28_030890 [Streblomastix strix]
MDNINELQPVAQEVQGQEDATNIEVHQQQIQFLGQLAVIKTQNENKPLSDREEKFNFFIFGKLASILEWARDKPQDIARPVQDAICQVLNLLLEGKKEKVNNALKSKIVKEIKALVDEILPVDEILSFHLLGIDYIFQLCSNLDYKNLYKKRFDQSIIRILKSTNSEVVETAVEIILYIILDGMKSFDDDQLPLFLNALEHDGIVNALYEDVLIKLGTSEKARNQAAISIGRLYEKTNIPQKYTNAVITQMKKGANSGIKGIQIGSLSTLSSLSQNENNFALIYSDDFQNDLMLLLSSDDNDMLEKSLQQTDIQYMNVSEEIKQQLFSDSPIEKIQSQTKIIDPEIQQCALKLYSWIKRRKEMQQLSALKKQIQIKPSDNRDQLVEQGAFNQICAVLREGIKGEDEYSGVVLFGFKVASLFLKYNK